MLPSLPQHASDQSERTAQLEQARKTYEYDYSFHGIGFVKKVPLRDQYSPSAIEEALKSKFEQYRNYADWAGSAALTKVKEKIEGWRHQFSEFTHEILGETRAQVRKGRHESLPQESQDYPLTPEAYADMFRTLKRPEMGLSYDQDWSFAYQKLAGSTPFLIKRVRQLPENFPVTNAHFQQALPDDSLDAALAEGRAFLLDFAYLDSFKGGEAYGHQKYIFPPLALFALAKTKGMRKCDLVPVAIQCHQKPSAENPIWTPRDGLYWQMAKYATMVAETNLHSNYMHFGQCHMIMELFTIATKRQLSKTHPLYVLLDPHYEFTLAANYQVRYDFALPGGGVDHLLSPALSESLRMVREGIAAFRLDDYTPPGMFDRNDTASNEALPDYPFRDDTVPVWQSLAQFVDAYVKLYYASDADVSGDSELQAFVAELQDPNAARMHGIGDDGKVETVASLSKLVAQIIYHGSAFHASINYASWHCYTFAPNQSYASFGPAPTPNLKDPQAALNAMYPPIKYAWEQFDTGHDQYSLWQNQIGYYPKDHFADQRVAPLLKKFQDELSAHEKVIDTRNKSRPVPYILQKPSMITASLQV
jgi:arachidonate 15-lipoxygenase